MSERKSDPLAAAEMDALIGHTVGGRFKITGRIARGGMACVYSATQGQLNRPVAIKVLRSSIIGSDASAEFRRRFLQEASMLSRLQHPNLVTLLDYGQITELPGDHYFIAMEYLQGETLARRFRTQGQLGVPESIRIARQVGRGLRETHRQGFVHRDLKPSNIMLVPEEGEGDIVKLIDFGIGKVVERSAREPANEEEDMTRVGLLLGSPRYMAPEQIRGDAVEPRTDLYGLGIILFQALTGRLPFEHKSDVDTMLAHCHDSPPPLDAYVEDPTGSLPELVADLLKKHPEDRPTVHDFLARLSNVEGELFDSLGVAGPTLSSTRPSHPPQAGRTSSRPAPPPRPPRTSSFGDDPPSLQELAGLVRARSEPPTVVTTGSFGSPAARAPDFLPTVAQQSASLAAAPPNDDALPLAPATEPRPRSSRGKALVGLLLLALVGGMAWLSLRTEPEPTAVVPKTPSTPSPPVRASFRLQLDSAPSEAVVKEGPLVLGKTPLDLEIQRASVSAGPRQFVVEREGFRPFTHAQADSTVDIATIVPLEANAAKPRAPRSRKKETGSGAAAAAAKPTTPPARPSARLDINLAR